MEVVGVCPPAVGLQGLEELECHALAPAREGNVEVELECLWIDHQLLSILFFVRIERASKPDFADIESGQFGDEINEAQNSSTGREHQVVASGFRQEAEAHWTLDLESGGSVVNLGG